MKKLYFILIFVFMSITAFAEQGQIKQTGFFSGTSKVIGDDKGNFSIIYEGTIGNKAIEGTTFGDRSSSYCVGSCLLYTSPSPRDKRQSRMPSSA